MATSDIIAIVFIIAVFIAVIGYFIINSNGKSNHIRSLMKKYPSFALILLDCEKLPPISAITKEQSAKILTLSDSDWEEWESLHKRVSTLVEKYPHTLYDFISSFFPNCIDRVNYKTRVRLFTPIPRRVKIAVDSLQLDELRKIDADPESVWKERDKLRLYAEKIRKKYSEGFRTYCDIHEVISPSDSDVVNDKRHIAELQKLYDESKAYEGWEKRQEEFSYKYWQILKDVRPQDGRYTYDISFFKPDRNGRLIESKFKVWQGFCDNFSSHLIDEQENRIKVCHDRITEFERCERYFYEIVYDQIFDIICKLNDMMSGNLCVVLIDGSKRNWSKQTYNYHYNPIRERLDESNYYWFNNSDLPLVNDNGRIAGIFILDLITSNDELRSNCKLIIEHFNKSVPLIGYYSMLKEFDIEEIKELVYSQK